MSHDADETLADALRAALQRADPVPPLVTESARAALTWRRIDAELAELLADSADQTAALAGARGSDAALRALTFSHRHLTIDLQFRDAGDGGRLLLGQLSPAVAATIELETSESPAVSIEVDDAGRFRTRLDSGATVRLRIREQVDPPPPWIQTSWITI
jgi:hypothetical protein